MVIPIPLSLIHLKAYFNKPYRVGKEGVIKLRILKCNLDVITRWTLNPMTVLLIEK